MTKQELELLESCGWEVECESPFEIRHRDGSFATRSAAAMVLFILKGENDGETSRS